MHMIFQSIFSFQPSSRLPITLLSDENLESQSMLCESKRCYREAATLSLKNNDVTRYVSTKISKLKLHRRLIFPCHELHPLFSIVETFIDTESQI